MNLDVTIEQACEGSWISCVSPDTWLLVIGTVIGSAIGTLIAGLIALKIARSQFKYQSDKEEVALLENSFKIYGPLRKHLDNITEVLEKVNKELDKETIDLEEIEKKYAYLIQEAESILSKWEKYKFSVSIPTHLYMSLTTLEEITAEFINLAVINNEGEITIDPFNEDSQELGKLMIYQYKILEEDDSKVLKKINEINKRLNRAETS